ncbi:MAG: lysophospholipid acyltransferase family protein [Corynebacterium sp.]|nr:lysophospholipid acyltransferase family protein [Corynebacterium sp.]
MHNKWYSIFRNVLFGPFLHVWNRPFIEHKEYLPREGAAILASNHQSVMDSFYLPLMCPRQITFLAKAEYFEGKTFVGKVQKWFFSSVGQVPIDRSSGAAAEAALRTAVKVIEKGDLFGIYPEGTRSPDGRVYKGKTGMARIALETGAPVIPIAMIDSGKANPIGSWFPRPVKVGIRVGMPIDPLAWVKAQGLDPESREARRALTDHVIHELARLTGRDYVDAYAADIKARLAEGKGYPEGLEPKA